MATIGLLPLARATFDVAYAEERCAALRKRLLAAGHALVGGEALLFDATQANAALAALVGRHLDLLLIVQVTFTDAAMTVTIAEADLAPLAMWAFPEPRTGGRLRLNSFCGLNLAAHALGLGGHAFSWAFAAPESSDVDGLVADILARRRRAMPVAASAPSVDAAARQEAGRTLGRLAGRRIGRIGRHPDGFHTCAYDPRQLDALAGISVDPIDLGILFEAARAAPAEAVQAARREAAQTLDNLDEVDQEELDRSLGLRVALEDLQERGGYSAFAVRCWPEMFTDYGGAVCGPVGMMGERRVPCACEADVHGALTNLILQEITGEAAFLVDLVDLDAQDETGVVWHCGQAPVSMRDPDIRAKATVHSNRRMPLLFEFPLKPGRVTFARLSRARGKLALVISGGEMIRRPLAFSGTAGVLRFDAPVPDVEAAIIGTGLEHHMGLVYGDHREKLAALAAEMGISVISI